MYTIPNMEIMWKF